MKVDGAKIRLLRENAGLTQTELARRSRVSKPYLCQIELGNRNPNPPVVARIANALDVAIVDLRD